MFYMYMYTYICIVFYNTLGKELTFYNNTSFHERAWTTYLDLFYVLL